MRLSDSFLDEIRDRVPISAVVGTRVSWDRKKTNAARGDWWACCPFHGEKTPSFHCEDRKGRYHCFGCGLSGDHFRFLTELEGMGFPEAVERVADMAGIAMPARDPEEEKREKQRASLHEVMELGARFFQEKLHAPEGAKARSYLRDRGLTPGTQQAFRLGYAPDSRNALKEFLASKNVAKEQMEACGLLVFGPDIPVSFDRFRDRIMFPIEDAKGRVIAFGGRALSADVPAKYLNSPETELFHKGNILYNLARARKAQGRDGTIIAVEGYMDVIALAQAGFDNAVAPLGTALTENQLELLWRMTGEPVLCFDGDQAGLRAAWRAAELALPLIQPGRTVRFALLPEGQDPDDLVRCSGKGAFAAVLEEARPLSDLLWMRETQGRTFDTPERRAELDKRLRDLTSRIHDESVRYHYQQDMRERAQSFFGASKERFRSAKGGREDRKGRTGGSSGRINVTESLARSAMIKLMPSKPLLREAALLMALINYPPLFYENSDLVAALTFENPHIAELHRVIVDIYAAEPTETRDEVLNAIACRNLKTAVDSLSQQLKGCYHWVAGENAALEDAREGFRQALALFSRSRELKEHGAELQLSLAEAMEKGDDKLATYLFDALKLNSEEIVGLERQEALLEGFGVLSGRAGA